MQRSNTFLSKNGSFVSSQVREHETKALSDRPELQLKLVQIFVRHGARTPIRLTPGVEEVTWDKDTIFEEADHLKCDYEIFSLDDKKGPHHSSIEHCYQQAVFKGGACHGQLTSVGMNQSYELGMCFRRHYMDEVKFLPPEFNSDHMFLRSTNMNRTMKSLSCILAAMYGGNGTFKNNEKGLPRIHIDHSSTEILYPNYSNSKPLMEVYYKTLKNTDIVPGVRPIRLKVQELLNLNREGFHLDLISVRDDISARLAHDLPLAPVLQPLASEIEKAAVDIMKHSIGCSTAHQNSLPYSVGPVLAMILDNMDKALKGESQRKLHLYSCHDTTLIALMTALGVFNDIWPGLCADFILEMYQDNNQAAYVRTLYLGKSMTINLSFSAKRRGLSMLNVTKERAPSLSFQELRLGPDSHTVIPLKQFQDLVAPTLMNFEDFKETLIKIETF